ncbi:MAG: hypothetical protein CMF74_09240 [Maricaulis sp.]|jgi:hypothetical protein|nr:hypothetical protein [Maricaulis sp.]HAQ36034.1 hypothetical protein [Alphaproteobacteria bacterium]|tara:strand:+ start:45 stop:308 length:264 start_codon:yes stop_codon:yes gene_type:complete
MSTLYKLFGIVLIIAGIPLLLTPIPVGLIIITLGLALIIANSNTARGALRRERAKHDGLNRWLIRAERVIPHPFDRILKETDAPPRR